MFPSFPRWHVYSRLFSTALKTIPRNKTRFRISSRQHSEHHLEFALKKPIPWCGSCDKLCNRIFLLFQGLTYCLIGCDLELTRNCCEAIMLYHLIGGCSFLPWWPNVMRDAHGPLVQAIFILLLTVHYVVGYRGRHCFRSEDLDQLCLLPQGPGPVQPLLPPREPLVQVLGAEGKTALPSPS
jgi:hypothetical protein